LFVAKFIPQYGPYSALSVGMKTPKIALSPWDLVTRELLEEDRAMAIGSVHKKLVKITHVVRETDKHTHTEMCLSQYFATTPTVEVIIHVIQQHPRHTQTMLHAT